MLFDEVVRFVEHQAELLPKTGRVCRRERADRRPRSDRISTRAEGISGRMSGASPHGNHSRLVWKAEGAMIFRHGKD